MDIILGIYFVSVFMMFAVAIGCWKSAKIADLLNIDSINGLFSWCLCGLLPIGNTVVVIVFLISGISSLLNIKVPDHLKGE